MDLKVKFNLGQRDPRQLNQRMILKPRTHLWLEAKSHKQKTIFRHNYTLTTTRSNVVQNSARSAIYTKKMAQPIVLTARCASSDATTTVSFSASALAKETSTFFTAQLAYLFQTCLLWSF